MLLVSFMISISSLKNVFDEENTAKMFDNFPVDINITYKDKNDLQDVSQMIKYVQDKAKVNNIVSKLKKKYTKDTIVIVDAVEEERKQMESLNNAVGLGTSIIYIISVVVCGIICLLLCTKTIQREEIDIGILKSEGFTDTELRLQFTMRFLFVSILGGILGILLNMLMNDAIMSMLLSNVGINKYKTVYTCNVVVMSVLSVCIFISLFSYIVAGRIKRITPKNLIND